METQKAYISLDFKTGLTLYVVARRLLDNRWFDFTTKNFVELADVVDQYIPLTESTIAETTYTCELDVLDSWNGDYAFKIFSKVGATYEPVSNEIIKTFEGGKVVRKVDDNILFPAHIIIDGFSSIMSTIAESSADTGYVTSSAAQTEFTDSGKNWEIDMWKDTIFSITTASDGLEHLGLVLSNTADTITFADIGTPIAAGDFYQLKMKINTTNLKTINGTTLTPMDWSAAFFSMTPGNTSTITRSTVLAATEGSFTLPNNTRSWRIMMEDGLPGESYYVSFVSGEVVTHDPADTNWVKVEGNRPVGDDVVDFSTGDTVYFSTDKVGGATFVLFTTSVV